MTGVVAFITLARGRTWYDDEMYMDTRSRCATVRDGQVPLSKLLLIAEFALRVDHVDQAGDVLDVLGGANQVRAHVR